MALPFRPRNLHRVFPTFVLAGTSVIVAASCVADNDEPLGTLDPSVTLPAAPVTPVTNAAEASVLAVRSLRTAFPVHADRVLGRTATRGFVSVDRGFARDPGDGLFMHLDVQLPHDAGEALRVTAPGGHEIRVQQIGVRGAGEVVDQAVVYRRLGGASFWTVTNGGAEEWLHFEAGVLRSEADVAAAWEVEGATPVLMQGAVALMDGGVARAWVSAPEAYSTEGRTVRMRLEVENKRIALYADARGEEVLLDPAWAAVAPTVTGRIGPSVTVLGSGKVLLAGGSTGAAVPPAAELYDPATNVWSSAGAMSTGRYGQRDALLGTGQVLIAGGFTGGGYTATAERYDPVANTWSSAGTMTGGRGFHAQVVLPNGKVLAAGGYNGSMMINTAQIYDPATNTWSAAASMATARGHATVVRLNDGRVLVAGGVSGTGGTITTNAEVYDPAMNTWTNTGNLITPRYYPTGALLTNGKVLLAGGYDTAGAPTANAELYDPATNSWTATGARTQATGDLCGVLLSNGRFLAAGGDNNASAVFATTDTYDPATGVWTSAGSLSAARSESGIAALPPGDALVANGAATIAFNVASNVVDRFVVGGQAVGTACSIAAQCTSGFCVDGVCCQVASCAASDSCHDVGTCQAGTGTCSNPVKPDGSTCSDNNACTQTDTCQAGTCTGANPVTCMASDQCHTAGTCNATTGVCDNPAKPDGSACSDGNACTQTDTCQAGACTGGNPVTCTASDQCHTAGTCNATTGVCDNPVKPDGSACNDNNACTQADACQNGTCTGANPVTCTASDQCHTAGTCNPATGVCDNPAKPDGSLCSDSNACTQTDTCQAGTCTGANMVVCTAMDQCHDVGTCNTITGLCNNPAKPDGATCSDNNACTQTDTCQTGVCKGINPITCTAMDQCHSVGTCDPMTGVCSNPAKADGSACNDGDRCTLSDTCAAGACVGANPVVCTAMDQCHEVGSCDPISGLCSTPVKEDGAMCDDGNGCTQIDSCTNGLCTGGNPVVCTATDSCHAPGDCDPGTGLCSDPEKMDGEACDDNNGCTESDTCMAGVCNGGTPVTCAAPDECHEAGACNTMSGMCDNPAKPDGTPCKDGTCQSGECKPGGAGGAGGGGGAGGAGGGGGDAGGSAGSGGSGGTGGKPTDDGSCGCRIAGSDDGSTSLAWAGLAVIAMASIRRRRPTNR